MIDLEGKLVRIDDATRHVTSVFPSDTNLTCTFTAAAGANTWSAWTEIVDSGATTLSSIFATNRGHITEMVIETISDSAAIYMTEIAWGAAKSLITTARFAGVGKFQSANDVKRFWSPHLGAGQTIYYRMKTETAVADTCTVHFRYHLH